MVAAARPTQAILALFPFLVSGMLPIAVMRAMRERGLDITLGRYRPTAGSLTVDACDDFEADGRLISLSEDSEESGIEKLQLIIEKRNLGLVINFGAPLAYSRISQLKERVPEIRIMDTLYNSGPHFHSFSAYHPCFDGVLVESDDMVRRLSLPGWPTAHKVESGVDLARFRPAGRAVDPVQAPLRVGYLGRMSIEKNPLGFVELAERLHDALPTIQFFMFGEGPMTAQVQARIMSGRAASAIKFAGFADHPTTALAQIDVLVVPSVLDGRPAAVMEANACGVPVIGAPVGGIPELIEEGRNGFLALPRNHERIAALLSGWQADPARFAALRQSARRVAEARFDRNRMMDRYEAVYRAVLARPARPVGICA